MQRTFPLQFLEKYIDEGSPGSLKSSLVTVIWRPELLEETLSLKWGLRFHWQAEEIEEAPSKSKQQSLPQETADGAWQYIPFKIKGQISVPCTCKEEETTTDIYWIFTQRASHWTLITLWGRYSDDFHFTGEQSKLQRLRTLPNILWLLNCGARILFMGCLTPESILYTIQCLILKAAYAQTWICHEAIQASVSGRLFCTGFWGSGKALGVHMCVFVTFTRVKYFNCNSLWLLSFSLWLLDLTFPYVRWLWRCCEHF